MDDIVYTTPEQQIEKLKSHHLAIADEEFAKVALNVYGYSNLIKSYRDPYVITSNNQKNYRSGISFEQLYSLYILDKNLRNAVMASMLDLEEHIKEATASIVANSFGVHQNDYLKYSNYRNKRKSKPRFRLSGILDTMNKTLDTDKDPIHHYNTEHGIVPPWILFKSIYFSTIVNFIDLLKVPEQEALAKKLYDVESLDLPLSSIRKLMMDTFYICLEYRNIAAHGGRTYNYICKNQLRTDEIFGASAQIQIVGFSQLLFLLDMLKYSDPYLDLKSKLDKEVNRHCNFFPQDVTYLGQILNMNIISRKVVYVSEKSNKYHNNPHCSGIKNINEMELEEAKKSGLIPCKRCCTNTQ